MEASKIGNLQESLVVAAPGWQSELMDGKVVEALHLLLSFSLSLSSCIPSYLFIVYFYLSLPIYLCEASFKSDS